METEKETVENKAPKEGLGDRMKKYEAKMMQKIDPKLPFIIRLDGHKFSSFTGFFKKPFDERIHNCMIATASELLVAFNPTTIYTCSDEITMVFALPPPNEEEEKNTEPPFSGKVNKLTTLTAGFASTVFNRTLLKQKYDPDTEKELIEHVEKSLPHFDSRIFQVPNSAELVNNLIWRCSHDYRRNSINGLAHVHFTTKELHKLNTNQVLEKLESINVSWEKMPDAYKYGSFLKRERYFIDAENEKTGEKVKAARTRVVVKNFPMKTCDAESEKFVTCKILE